MLNSQNDRVDQLSVIKANIPPDTLNSVFMNNHSLMQKIDPRARIIGTLIFAPTVVLSTEYVALFAALLWAFLMAAMANLALKSTLKKLAVMDSFMLYLLIMLPFTIQGDAFLEVLGYQASWQGLERGVKMTLKANAVVLMIFACVSIIPSSALGSALYSLKASPKLIQLLLFTVRYLSVIANEFQRLRRAMKARAFVMKFNRHSWKSMGYLIAMMLLRALKRSEQMTKGMKCRGFNGQFISYYPLNWQLKDTLFLLVMLIFISGLISLNFVSNL